MPPITKLTREDIAEKALYIIRTRGYDALNARSLATELGCSTMPLFKHYSNMDEIRKVAKELGEAIYCSYIERGMKEVLPFKGAGREYIRFAQDEPELFRMFFMMPTDKVAYLSDVDPNRKTVLDITTNIMNGNNDKGETILKNMWIFVHGIASLEVTGKMHFSDEEISKMMSETFLGLRSVVKEEK